MAEIDEKNGVPDSSDNRSEPGVELTIHRDEDELAHMGYVQEIPRRFTLLSIFGIGYSVCGTATALIITLVAGLGSGGQALYIWGQLLMYAVSFCVAISLAELASAWPNAGGQYYWSAMLAPPKIRHIIPFVVGTISWGSAVVTCASVTLGTAQMIVAMYTIHHPDANTDPWVVFVTYQIFNVFMFGFNCWERFINPISRGCLAVCVASAAIIFITMLARAPTKQSASFVFQGFTNITGWDDGLAFLAAMLAINWGFSCLDAVTHMAEEIPDPKRNVPRAVIGTVSIGALLSWPMAIAVMFTIQNVDELLAGGTGVTSLDLFLQIFEGKTAGPLALQSLIVICMTASNFGIHTWQARLAWAFARDNGFPFSKYLKRIAPAPYEVPLWAHLWSCAFMALLGCLYLGSSIAFNSFISGGILMQYVSYSICIILLLKRGRDNIPHGPFWLGKIGLVCNIVTVCWTLFTLVFYSFPPYKTVTPSTMNYVSVVLVGFLGFFAGYYALFARKTYTRLPTID